MSFFVCLIFLKTYIKLIDFYFFTEYNNIIATALHIFFVASLFIYYPHKRLKLKNIKWNIYKKIKKYAK
jgi:hypothetical protein